MNPLLMSVEILVSARPFISLRILPLWKYSSKVEKMLENVITLPLRTPGVSPYSFLNFDIKQKIRMVSGRVFHPNEPLAAVFTPGSSGTFLSPCSETAERLDREHIFLAVIPKERNGKGRSYLLANSTLFMDMFCKNDASRFCSLSLFLILILLPSMTHDLRWESRRYICRCHTTYDFAACGEVL